MIEAELIKTCQPCSKRSRSRSNLPCQVELLLVEAGYSCHTCTQSYEVSSRTKNSSPQIIIHRSSEVEYRRHIHGNLPLISLFSISSLLNPLLRRDVCEQLFVILRPSWCTVAALTRLPIDLPGYIYHLLEQAHRPPLPFPNLLTLFIRRLQK